MRYIKNYQHFKESRQYRGHGRNIDSKTHFSFPEIKEGLQILKTESLNEGYLGDLFDSAKQGLTKFMSKIPVIGRFFQDENVKNVAEELMKRDDIDKLTQSVYDQVLKQKGEVTAETLNQMVEEDRPLVLPPLGTKQYGDLTRSQKIIGHALLFIMLLSIGTKTFAHSGYTEETPITKIEMTDQYKKTDDIKAFKWKGFKYGGDGDDGDDGGDVDGGWKDDGKINYLHSSSSASKAYQSELGKDGHFDKGLQRGSDGTYNHVYETTLDDFYKIVEGIKSGEINKDQALSLLKALPQAPDANNPNLFQVGENGVKAPNGAKINKLFDLRGKDGKTKIRLSGNGLYNFGRLIEAASKMSEGDRADFVKITMGSDVDDSDARGAFSFEFDAGGMGSTIKANLNKIYTVMRGKAFNQGDFYDSDFEGPKKPLLPEDRSQDEMVGGEKTKTTFVNLFKFIVLMEKGGKETTLQDVIIGDEKTDDLYKVIRGICKRDIVENLFKSNNPSVPDLLTADEMKNLGLELVNDDVIRECLDHFKSLQKSPDEVRLKAQLPADLEKKFLDEVERVVVKNIEKYIDYKMKQSGGDEYRSLPSEVLDAIKADVTKNIVKKIGISKVIKQKDLERGYAKLKKKAPSPEEERKETERLFGEGDF